MAPKKARMKHALRSLRRRKEKAKDSTQQSESPLFNLPPELREKIWAFALTPPDRPIPPKSPHFHIYDTVYDACTYVEVSSEYKSRRRQLTQMSLLLTCRAAYSEALRFLYEDEHFTLVLFAGRPRPNDHVLDQMSKRNSLGAVKDCAEVFHRMRKVTLVVQPGVHPDAEKYAARARELLHAMDYGRRTKQLTLHFALRITFLSHEGGEERFQTITRAFYPLQQREGEVIIQSCALWGYINPVELFTDLAKAIPGAKVSPRWHIERRNRCMIRGTHGNHEHDQVPWSVMTKGEKVADSVLLASVFTVYLSLLPVTLPLTYLTWRKYKLDKGEW